MLYYHATPSKNLSSILGSSVDDSCSSGSSSGGISPKKAILHRGSRSRKYVWLHTRSNTPWAILHTMKKHKVELDAVSILVVDIPKGWVRRHQLVSNKKVIRGIWKTDREIPVSRIVEVIPAEVFAAGVSED